MELINAIPQDALRLAELNQKMIQDSGHNNGLGHEGLYHRMRDWLISGEYQAHFISYDGQMIGYCLTRRESGQAHLRQFYIEPEYRRNGLGTQAVQLLLNGHLSGMEMIHLDVHPGNAAGIDFWRANGFDGAPEFMQLNLRQLNHGGAERLGPLRK